MGPYACRECTLVRCSTPASVCDECQKNMAAAPAKVSAPASEPLTAKPQDPSEPGRRMLVGGYAGHLKGAFDWSRTRQGREFWQAVYDEFVHMSQHGVHIK